MTEKEKAFKRFESVGEGTTIVSDKKEWEKAKEAMRKRLEELKKNGS